MPANVANVRADDASVANVVLAHLRRVVKMLPRTKAFDHMRMLLKNDIASLAKKNDSEPYVFSNVLACVHYFQALELMLSQDRAACPPLSTKSTCTKRG